MKNFKVICEDTCPTCEGCKAVNRLMDNYLVELNEIPEDVRYSQDFDDELWDEEWAKGNGYASMEALEADDKECPSCKGTGIISQEVSLFDVLHELGCIQDKWRCVGNQDDLIMELRKMEFSHE
jgi:O-succinylbenzoate synthase